MSYDPRTIAFLIELIHPPQKHAPEALQALHGELFRDPLASYQNFTLNPGGALFSNPPASAQMRSFLNFLPDRIQITEELSGISIDDYCYRLEKVARLAKERLRIPFFAAQQCIVRSLVNPRLASDSREFLAKRVFQFTSDHLKALGRPVQLLGMRFVFPKTQPDGEIYSLRLESYNNDLRSLFLENVGTFAPLAAEKEGSVWVKNLRASYRFLTEEGLKFIALFDQQEERR